MSAGSRTNPGGYTEGEKSLEQFSISDDRSPSQICNFLQCNGYDPVWKDWDLSYDKQRMLASKTIKEENQYSAHLVTTR